MEERRYYGLDALRGGMMMLGIVLHAAMMYLVTPPRYFPTDSDRSAIFDVVFDFIHSFRMPTFFVLAGFFACLLVEKRGVRGMYRNRAARILAPLAASMATLLPVTLVLTVDFLIGARLGILQLWPEHEAIVVIRSEAAAHGMPVGELPLAHLWFLYYLCLFYLLVPACRWLAARARRIDASVRRLTVSPLLWLALSLGTAATLWPFKGGQVHEGFMYLKPHLPSLVYYGSFFVLGYLLHGYRDLFPALGRVAPAFAALAAVLFPLCLYASGLDNRAGNQEVLLHVFAVVANGLCTWALIYALLGAAVRYLDRDSPWIVYSSQASYWVFLVHLPLVVSAGWWLLQFSLPAVLKFVLVCAFTCVIALTTFHYWVQRSWLSDFLHGRRFDLDWPWARARAIRAAAE